MNLKEIVTSIIPKFEPYLGELEDLFKVKTITEKTILLEDGDVSRYCTAPDSGDIPYIIGSCPISIFFT